MGGSTLEAEQIKRRKELYLFLHPETNHGGDRRSSAQNANLKTEDTDRFAKVEAEATGKNEVTIARAASGLQGFWTLV